MAFKIKKRGEFVNQNEHNHLKNLELSDQHPITSIINLKNILNNIDIDIKDINKKIELNNEVYNLSRPRFKKEVKYDINGNVSSETYSGNINKTIEYQYNDNNQLIKKTVIRNNGKTFESNYVYDLNGKLVEVIDNGTQEEYIHRAGGIASYISIKDQLSASDPLMIVDMNQVFSDNDMATIINSEFFIQNLSSSVSRFTIKKGDAVIVESSVDSASVQKYILGVDKDIQIYVTGNIKFEVIVSFIQNTYESETGLDKNVIAYLKNIGKYISDMQLRYDTLLQSVDNTNNSFTDILVNDSNLDEVVNYTLEKK